LHKVTINVVARHAGVSKKTVSRVLNNESNVTESTRRKVQAAIDELGYVPSVQARALARNQSFLIGLIYDNPNASYVADIQKGALKVCRQRGYHLVIHPTDHESSTLLEELEELLSTSRLDGLILTPPFSDRRDILQLLQQRHLPFARVAPTQTASGSVDVISDDFDAAKKMTEYLISLGHQRIGFIKGHPDHPVSEQRLAGYRAALQAADIEFKADYVRQGYFNFRSGEEAARKLLSLTPLPTAIFASNDFMAAGVLKVASQKGLSVPHELSVAGFDDSPISRHIWPSITTVKQPVEAMAEQATDMLLAVIGRTGDAAPITHFVDSLVIRNSTAPAKA